MPALKVHVPPPQWVPTPPTGNPGSTTEMDLSSTNCFKKTYPALTIDSVQYSKKIQSIKF